MDVHAVNYFCFRSPVMNMELDPICHVVSYGAVLQSDISACGVQEDPAAPISCDVGITDGNSRTRHCDVDPIVCRVLHLEQKCAQKETFIINLRKIKYRKEKIDDTLIYSMTGGTPQVSIAEVTLSRPLHRP